MSFASESSEISYTPRINYVNGHQSSYRARGLIPGTIYKIQLKAEIKVGDGFQESLPAVTVGWGRRESSDKYFKLFAHSAPNLAQTGVQKFFTRFLSFKVCCRSVIIGATNLDPPKEIKFLSSSSSGLEFEWNAPEAPVTHFIVKIYRSDDNSKIADIKQSKDDFKVIQGQNREVYRYKVENLQEGKKYLIQIFSANLNRIKERFAQLSVGVEAEATVTATMPSVKVSISSS